MWQNITFVYPGNIICLDEENLHLYNPFLETNCHMYSSRAGSYDANSICSIRSWYVGPGHPLAGVGAKSDISCCSAWDCREFWHLAWAKQSRRIYTKGTISRKNYEFVNLIQRRMKTIEFVNLMKPQIKTNFSM